MNIEKPSFKRICLMHLQALTNFPYIEKDFDAITDYELLSRVVDYLNQVISNNNEQNTVVKNLYDAFAELKDYVDNYFDDLDVQEEINNKLDEMAESGQLTDIIAQYLGLAGMITFNTVSEMKNATNLVNGSKCETLGYYSVNDGGNAIYKVRNVTNEDVVDEMFIISLNNNSLIAELIIDENTNVKQLGAKGDDTNDDTTPINSMIEKLGYAYLPNGIYKTTSSIILTSNQSIYGQDKVKTKIHYTGNSNCITNEDISTSNHISIHDLTIQGTNKTGKGIYLIRTTKNGDTWHRIYNMEISDFEYGLYLFKNLNEIQINDIKSTSNEWGIYIKSLNDFYMERCVCAVNNKTGLYIADTTEGRISDVKSWYNGSADASAYSNIHMTSCLAIMMNNIGCQESYGNNMRMTYSKNIGLQNCFLSKPSLDGNEHYQLYIENLQDSKLNIQTNNYKVNGEYVNKILTCRATNIRNNINILVESDFPDNKLISQESSNNGYSFNIKNNIVINNKTIETYKNLNYIINGDISNTTNLNGMITAGRDYCSYNNGKLRIANTTESAITVTVNHPVLPTTGLYTFYMKFRKVSGTGRLVLQYNGYKDITAETSTDEELYASYAITKNSTAAATNINISIPAGLTVDVEEIGLCEGITCNTNNPMYSKSILS